LDGLESWVAIKNINHNGETEIKMVFDKELVPINGVYEVTNWFSKDGVITGRRFGTAKYGDYPNEFPNDGKEIKPLITFEAGGQVVFGEVALEVADAGFEFGVEGNLLKLDYASDRKKNYGFEASSFITNEEDKVLNVGGGGSVSVAGIEYRRKFDTRTGTFTDDATIEADGPLTKIETNPNTGESSFKIGIPESKVSIGLGLKGWLNLSINKTPKLTYYEDVEKKAREKEPVGTKTDPTY
jgi:hypothetical protein